MRLWHRTKLANSSPVNWSIISSDPNCCKIDEKTAGLWRPTKRPKDVVKTIVTLSAQGLGPSLESISVVQSGTEQID